MTVFDLAFKQWYNKRMMELRRKNRRALWKLAGFLAAFLLFAEISCFSALALSDWPSDCYVLSEGACLLDADTGVVLFEQNAGEAYYPASITKVLTALTVLENCDNLSEMVTFSYDAVHIEEQNSTIIGASEGDRLSVLDCLYCLLFQSANEVANALAEHVGAKHPELKEKGDTDLTVFVKLMNQRAAEAGARGSHFNNPSGLTDENHYTTPYDMCMIMRAAIQNEMFRDIESHTYWTHAPIAHYPDAEDPWNTVYMKHMMLRKNSDQYYSGCIAGKTGYTVTAGNTLVTACERDGMTLLCCVMNAHANHYNDTRRLFDFGFENYKSVGISEMNNVESLIQSDFQIAGIPVLDSFTIGVPDDTKVTIPKDGELSDIRSELLVSGGTGGEMVYTYGSHEAGRSELVLKPLGGMKDMVSSAEDPVFYKIAGIDPPPETEKVPESEAVSGEAEEPEGIVPESTVESAGTDTEAEPSGAREPERKKPERNTVLLVCGGILSVLLVAGGGLLLKLRREQKEAMRRQKHRRERMWKTADLTGSQRIQMDLLVQEKSKKNGSHRRR